MIVSAARKYGDDPKSYGDMGFVNTFFENDDV